MNLTQLKQINFQNIAAAGPRYTPGIEPNAPNLEISSLLTAIEALSHTEGYINFLTGLKDELVNAWGKSQRSIKSYFSEISPNNLIKAFNDLIKQKVGKSDTTLKLIEKITEKISLILREESEKLREKESNAKGHSDELRAIQSELSSIRKIESSISNVWVFINSTNFKLISTNRMLLLGDWGTGKTHFLCDATKLRMKRGLPTLFFLANRLPQKKKST